MQEFPTIHEFPSTSENGSRGPKVPRARLRGVCGVRARNTRGVHGAYRERVEPLWNTDGGRINERLFLQASEKVGSGTATGWIFNLQQIMH